MIFVLNKNKNETITMKLTNLNFILLFLLMTLTHKTSATNLENKIANALKFAEIQLDKHAQRKSPNRYTCYTNLDGKWRSTGMETWCSGFPGGLMWMMYDHTKERKWANYAREWTSSVRARATATDQDTSFQIYNSFGYGLRYGSDLLSDAEVRDYESVLRWATNTFTTQRYNTHVGGFRTWPALSFDPYNGVWEINSDMIMNLELPLWVATNTNDLNLRDKISRHEELMWKNTVYKEGDTQWISPENEKFVLREIGSHYHVVGYDPRMGVVTHKRTEQGDKTESTWSRGQSWLVYGYPMLYRYTGYPKYLERAEVVFDYYMKALKAQSKNAIPYSDFDALVDDQNPLDTAAAAIVASASIELYQLTGQKKYLEAAEWMLNELTSEPYLATNTAYESILTRGSHSYHQHYEAGTLFGDFFFVEAMLRYLQLKNK